MYEELKNIKIILGVTGSISAYKSPMIVRELIKAGAHVNVVMTQSAKEFVTALTLSNLSRNPVISDMFSPELQDSGAWHIQLANWCDAMLIAPCSASTLSKIANGNCDTALTTIALALNPNTPLIVSPAMDSTMWEHHANQRNVNTVISDGTHIIQPEEGELSSGIVGKGRLPEIDTIMKELISVISKKKLNSKQKEYLEEPHKSIEDAVIEDSFNEDSFNAELEFEELKLKKALAFLYGKNVLITAGPTYEKIDDVRFIGNHSSGKMGFALAHQAARFGAIVTLITGPVSLKTPENVKRIDVISASEMYNAVSEQFNNTDIAIMSSAVSDFTPSEVIQGKIKKNEFGETMSIDLVATKDILAEIGKRKKSQILVGFALESTNELEYGKDKLDKKNCDMIVLNSAGKPDSGFGGDNNTITILTHKSEPISLPPMTKDSCAIEIFKQIGYYID